MYAVEEVMKELSLCFCVGSHRVYGRRGAHQSGGADGGGGAGSGPDTRDHQGPGERERLLYIIQIRLSLPLM